MQTQSSEVEVSCIFTPLLVTEAMCAHFDRFDPAVYTFGEAMADLPLVGIHNITWIDTMPVEGVNEREYWFPAQRDYLPIAPR